MSNTQLQVAQSITSEDSSWSSGSKLGRKVRELAHRSHRMLKAGTQLHESPNKIVDDPDDLRRPGCAAPSKNPRATARGSHFLDRRIGASAQRPARLQGKGRNTMRVRSRNVETVRQARTPPCVGPSKLFCRKVRRQVIILSQENRARDGHFGTSTLDEDSCPTWKREVR